MEKLSIIIAARIKTCCKTVCAMLSYIVLYLDLNYLKFSCAYFISSSRKSGCAMEAIASARSRSVLPERLAMPYSVATYWIIVRGAEIVLPPAGLSSPAPTRPGRDAGAARAHPRVERALVFRALRACGVQRGLHLSGEPGSAAYRLWPIPNN